MPTYVQPPESPDSTYDVSGSPVAPSEEWISAGDAKEAIRVLQVERGLSQYSMDRIINRPWPPNYDVGERTTMLERDPSIRAWANGTHSCALFVNGGFEGPASESPTEMFLASFVSSHQRVVSPSERTPTDEAAEIYLSYFCGEYNPPDCARVPHMIRCLISQLIDDHIIYDNQYILGLVRDGAEDSLDDCDRMLLLFISLLAKLSPRATVCCVVDAITAFDDPRSRAEVNTLVTSFLRMARREDPRVHCKVKFIFSCQSYSQDLSRLFEQQEVITLDSAVPPRNGDTGGYIVLAGADDED